MKLEEDFRQKLQGQLSSEKTELDVTVASRIAREFASSFFIWAKSYQINDRNNWHLTTKELLEIYENETK